MKRDRKLLEMARGNVSAERIAACLKMPMASGIKVPSRLGIKLVRDGGSKANGK
jgi:hypothetical protein